MKSLLSSSSSSLPLLLSSLLLSLQSTVTVQAASSIIYQTSVGVSVGPGNGFSEGRPSDDIAYLTTANGNLYTIQESTGTILNTVLSDGATSCNTIVEWNPDYTTGVYAVGNTIHMINRDGTLQQSFAIEQGTVTDQPIIIKDDIVLVTSNDSTNGYISLYEAPRVFSRLTISGSFLGPLSAGGSYNNDILYVGASNGFLLTVDIRDARNDAQISVFGNGINFNQDMRGRAYATDSSLVVQTPAGDLYWWAGSDGSFNVQPDFTARLETEGSSEYNQSNLWEFAVLGLMSVAGFFSWFDFILFIRKKVLHSPFTFVTTFLPQTRTQPTTPPSRPSYPRTNYSISSSLDPQPTPTATKALLPAVSFGRHHQVKRKRKQSYSMTTLSTPSTVKMVKSSNKIFGLGI